MRLALALCAALSISAASDGAAEVVRLRCKTSGKVADFYGDALVTVDEAARFVRVEAAKQPGFRNEYHDGAFGILNVGPLDLSPFTDPVEQFVQIGANQIVVGWRDAYDDAEYWTHASSFNRAALRKNGPPCVWHSYEDLAAG